MKRLLFALCLIPSLSFAKMDLLKGTFCDTPEQAQRVAEMVFNDGAPLQAVLEVINKENGRNACVFAQGVLVETDKELFTFNVNRKQLAVAKVTVVAMATPRGMVAVKPTVQYVYQTPIIQSSI